MRSKAKSVCASLHVFLFILHPSHFLLNRKNKTKQSKSKANESGDEGKGNRQKRREENF